MTRKRRSTDAFPQQAKRARTSPSSSTAAVAAASSSSKVLASTKPKTDNNGDTYWEISRMRRVTVSTFRGKTLVNIREYYEKDGQELPGKKGISMSLDQFNALIEILPNLEDLVQQKGGSLARPVYGAGNGAAQEDEEGEDKEEEEPNEEDIKDEEEEEEEMEEEDEEEEVKSAKKDKKQNIEATSDEEESEED